MGIGYCNFGPILSYFLYNFDNSQLYCTVKNGWPKIPIRSHFMGAFLILYQRKVHHPFDEWNYNCWSFLFAKFYIWEENVFAFASFPTYISTSFKVRLISRFPFDSLSKFFSNVIEYETPKVNAYACIFHILY